MNKLIIVITCVLCLALGSGVTIAVQETMEIPYSQGQLSSLTFICGNKAYMKIFSGISASDVTNVWNDLIVLKDKKITEIDLYINSPGGDAFTGLAIADQLKLAIGQGFTITGHATGIVASAAVPIFAVCSRRLATIGTIFMVHEAALWKWPGRETASDIRSQNELMVMLQKRYLNYLVDASNLTYDDWSAMERKTTWFSAEQALEWGLADAIQ